MPEPLTDAERARLRPDVDVAALERFLAAAPLETRPLALFFCGNDISPHAFRELMLAAGVPAEDIAGTDADDEGPTPEVGSTEFYTVRFDDPELQRLWDAVAGPEGTFARGELGGPLGVGPSAPDEGPGLTERAWRILTLAHAEAAGLGHAFGEPEHLLLALLVEGESVQAAVLRHLGADVNALAAAVRAALGPVGALDAPTGGKPWMTARAEQTVQLAEEEARGAGAGLVATDHLLVAALRTVRQDVAKVLQDAGVTADTVRAASRRLRGGYPPAAAPPSPDE